MEDYTKGEVKELDDDDQAGVSAASGSVVLLRVNAGTKIRNILTYALKRFNDPTVRQITWNGSGQVTTKVISCAEMTKRKVKGLYQVTTIKFKRIEEYWDPIKEGLERLKVNRDIPSISILLSKDPVDTTLAGYQAPDSCDILDSRRRKSSCSDRTNNDMSTPRSRQQQTVNRQQRGNRQRQSSSMTCSNNGSAAAAVGSNANASKNSSASKRMKETI